MSAEPRPVGVSLLALLHIVGGLVGSLLLLLALLAGKPFDLSASILGIPAWVAVIPLALAMLTGFLAGFGLWLGRAWGWWLAVVYYTYSILRNTGTVVMAIEHAQGEESPGVDVDRFVYKHGGRVVINTLIMLYLFRRSILDYFDLYTLSRGRTIAKLVGGVGAAVAAISLLASLIW